MTVLSVAAESFPIAGQFVIARGAKTQAQVVIVTLCNEEGARGRGECVPYGRYGETVASVIAAIEEVRPAIEAGMPHADLLARLAPGAARNAVDCAFWDLSAKITGVPAHVTAGLPRLGPATTAFTISVGAPAAMAEAVRRAGPRPVLKIKLAGDGDEARLRAVRAAAPEAELILDANESWNPGMIERMMEACADAGVALIEQPLPAGADTCLRDFEHLVPVCADESIHDRSGLPALRERYDAINIKLDKAGGLSEALELARAAKGLGFDLMAGCMVATSLSMAPAMLLAPQARFVDLDGPLLLARDRPDGLRYEGSTIYPPEPALWG